MGILSLGLSETTIRCGLSLEIQLCHHNERAILESRLASDVSVEHAIHTTQLMPLRIIRLSGVNYCNNLLQLLLFLIQQS